MATTRSVRQVVTIRKLHGQCMINKKPAKEITVLEPLVSGQEHVPVNSALVACLVQTYPDHVISVFAETSHLEMILSGVVAQNVRSHSIQVPARHARFWQRFRNDLANVRLCIQHARAGGGAPIIILCSTPSIVFAIKLLGTAQSLRGRKQPFVCFLHSVLAQVRGWRSHNPFLRITDMKSALVCFGNGNIEYCVLENHIMQVVGRLLPRVSAHMHVIPHPIAEEELCLDPKRKPRHPFQFAFVGTATAEKGFASFMEAAENISQRLPGLAEFHLIGRLGADVSASRLDVLKTKPQRTRWARDTYLQKIREMDFVVFPLGEEYELFASGALLDAIAAARPLVISESLLADDLRRQYGEIGRIIHDGDLVRAIESLLSDFDHDTYDAWVRNLLALAASRTPAAIGRDFRRLLSSLK